MSSTIEIPMHSPANLPEQAPTRCLTAFSVIGLIVGLGGCAVTVPMAPSADSVKVTAFPADVASCHAVGNLAFTGSGGVMPYAQAMNQAIGLGGDTILDTTASSMHRIGDAKVLGSGIVYRCDDRASGQR